MALQLVESYQAFWRPHEGKGHFYFTYQNGDRRRTPDMGVDSFRIVLDILRNEKPVYGDHTTGEVTTQTEPTGEEESPKG